MQSSAAYAAVHPVTCPIRLVETHVSWVFLTGPYAYKVKKPLALSFLDYSTPARREMFCREELRLNRRYAPGVYVDVVGIGGTPEAPLVGSESRPFEHALRMRQFDPQLELTNLLAARDVSEAELADFAADLARLHATAPRASLDSGFATPAALHRVTLENFADLRRTLPDGGSDEHLFALRDGLETQFTRVRDRMEMRRGDGFVRECHGDLHCGNVVRWEGRLVAFDALEFDPALRYIDVANDLAFLTMDLGAHGRSDLRRVVLDAWAAASGDYAAVELLPYYEAYRALVRAKVAALRSQQGSTAATRLAHQYLEWERGQASRHAPTLTVMSGLSGSGKTWLARRIGAACDALLVRSDVERKRLAGLGPLDPSGSAPDGGLYTREFGERTYARLLECAAACLRGRESVVIDAANLRRHERAAFIDVARREGASVAIVHCTAPLPVLKERVAARSAAANDASEATVELLDRQPAYWEALTPDEQAVAHVVDTSDPRAVDLILGAVARLRP